MFFNENLWGEAGTGTGTGTGLSPLPAPMHGAVLGTLIHKFPLFTVSYCSLPCSQKHTTGLQIHSVAKHYFFTIHFNIPENLSSIPEIGKRFLSFCKAFIPVPRHTQALIQ